MSKRISVTLPDNIAEELTLWAEQEGKTTARLAAFLLESAVRQNRSTIDLPDDLSEKLKRLADSNRINVVNLAKNLLMEAIRQAQEDENPSDNNS